MTKQGKWNKRTLWFLGFSFLAVAFIVVNGMLNVTASYSMSEWIMGFLFPEIPFGHPLYGQYQTVVRKIAHLAEYGALGMWLWFLKLSLEKSEKQIHGLFFCFTLLLIGMLDEFFQSLSQRSGRVSDIIIDLLGGLLGMAAAIGIHWIYVKIRNRRNRL